MRMRFLQLFAITVALSLATWAQDTSKTTPPSPDKAAAPSAQSSGSVAAPDSSAKLPESDKSAKEGKTLKGCIRSDNGKFFLEEKSGKIASIQSTDDLTAHVGHEVKVQGDWQAASASAGAGASTGSSNLPASDTGASASANKATDHPDQTFAISKVDMVSESCTLKSNSKSESPNTKSDTNTATPQKY